MSCIIIELDEDNQVPEELHEIIVGLKTLRREQIESIKVIVKSMRR